MVRETLHRPFEIVTKTLDQYPDLEHKHTFFELVYIISGTGQQCINKSTFKYKPRHMFLLTPQDCHAFNIEAATTFFFLRFNDIYIRQNSLREGSIRQLEFILQNASHEPGCILKNQADKDLVDAMVKAIIRDYDSRDAYNEQLVRQLVDTLIVVVARNIASYLPDTVGAHTDDKAMDILQYIQQNIYSPDKIRARTISEKFAVSESYLGRYFKKQTQQSMQEYINDYRSKLIEHRLKHSDLRVGEIASELGFTDESHLNKFFKTHRGKTPSEYRRALRQPVSS